LKDVEVEFFDSIVTPWRKLNSMLSEHPLALKPTINSVVASAKTLVITLNHFKEQYSDVFSSSFQISGDLRNLANSSKHDKGAETRVLCSIAPNYEHADGKFRFITNKISCNYPAASKSNKDREFDAAVEIWKTLQSYAQTLGIDVTQFSPRESNYVFLPVAVAFYKSEYSAYTKCSRIQINKRTSEGYKPFDPTTVPYVVLDEDLLGSDLTKMDWSFVTT
jgi:hypothetical protein